MVGFLDAITGIAGIAGAAGNLFGGKEVRTPAQESGYQSLYRTGNEDFTNFTKNEVLQQIMNAGRAPRVGRPLRRLNESDMADPTFAPKALQALQQYKDYQPVANAQASASASPAEAVESAASRQQSQNAQIAQTMQRLQMLGGNPETDMRPEAKKARGELHRLSIMKDMDGYQNEFTGGKFNLDEYLAGINTAYDEQATSGYTGGLGGIYSPTAKKAWETTSQQTDNALRRPPEMDYLGPIVAALITGGAGFAGGAPILGGLTNAGKLAGAAGSLAQRAAGKR